MIVLFSTDEADFDRWHEQHGDTLESLENTVPPGDIVDMLMSSDHTSAAVLVSQVPETLRTGTDSVSAFAERVRDSLNNHLRLRSRVRKELTVTVVGNSKTNEAVVCIIQAHTLVLTPA